MRRFRWYFLDEGTEGVLYSNGCVSHTIDDAKGRFYFYSLEEFVKAYGPDRIEWLDPENQGELSPVGETRYEY